MAWTYDRALSRINRLKNSAPEVQVETFADQYLPRFRRLRETMELGDATPSAPLFNLSNSEAVIVDAVHVYVNLLDFNDALMDNQRETESAHARALKFLHFHYNASDRAVEDAGAQRVDFHGARLHAVVVEPSGAVNELARITRALELAERIRRLAAEAVEEFGGGLASRYRIGIDSGLCIAINSGRGSEPEPLFLGNAANQAAKLAEGNQPGVFVSAHVAAVLRAGRISAVPLSASLSRRGVEAFDASALSGVVGRNAFEASRGAILDRWRSDVAANKTVRSGGMNFVFHYHQPPLASIVYDKLSAAHSIRMPVATVFADIDGYTSYIQSVMNDLRQAGEAVGNLHVIRGEMAAVVRDDFEGRKIRFIGDCIHAIVALGDSKTVDEIGTVTRSIHMAGALRSSFDLTKQVLPGIGGLGLAIGIDLGQTPVSRIGIRGDRSVRVSVSKASIEAEEKQSDSGAVTTAIGDRALAAGSAAARSLFRTGSVDHLTYDVALSSVPLVSTPPTITGEEGRAHCVAN